MQNFNKKDRVPNTILGALLKHHYPQIVYDTTERPPKNVAATKWRHWCMKGPQDNTCADRVRSDFLARYKWPDDEPELKDKFMKTLEACCTKLATQEIYDLRVYAVVAFQTEILEEITEFEEAKLIHLDAHEYRLVPFSWVNIDAWNELSIWWGSEEFKTTSAMKRAARLSRPQSVNCGGSSSVTRTQQCLEATYGRPFSLIEGFAVHMGASKQAVAQGEGNELPPLANDRAQEHLDNYRDGMKEVHGENIPWVKAPFDPQVMYNRTGRKPHGKFAIADGAIDSSEVQFSTNVRPQTQSSNHREKELEQEVRDLKRQRQQDCQSFYNAFAKFNEDMAQYMRLGCANAPPPQINLAALFPNPLSTPSEMGTMQNNSAHATLQQTGGNPSEHVDQQSPTRTYQQDHVGHNSGSAGLQRMDGSTFGYFAQQSTHNTSEQELMPNNSGCSTGNQATNTTNYHSTHMRNNDAIDDIDIFF